MAIRRRMKRRMRGIRLSPGSIRLPQSQRALLTAKLLFNRVDSIVDCQGDGSMGGVALKHNPGDIMSLEDIMACIGIDSRKGPIKSENEKNEFINLLSRYVSGGEAHAEGGRGRDRMFVGR
ncbi:uncharacterized protein LOC126605613 [Malus sylvestris]|uniref:uncharacterized protein LOC126605613 n=1 Tax=Malus sylvestris TaxID=3752 RepID=UPI0021ACB98D|nr:uncharacterized protein LOC126605613 [Malus sylvestris]